MRPVVHRGAGQADLSPMLEPKQHADAHHRKFLRGAALADVQCGMLAVWKRRTVAVPAVQIVEVHIEYSLQQPNAETTRDLETHKRFGDVAQAYCRAASHQTRSIRRQQFVPSLAG